MGDVSRIKTLKEQSTGAMKEGIVLFNGSASYATGGDRLTAKQICLKYIKFAQASTLTESGTYWVDILHPANVENPEEVKVIFTVRATGAETANAVNLSAERFRVDALGMF